MRNKRWIFLLILVPATALVVRLTFHIKKPEYAFNEYNINILAADQLPYTGGYARKLNSVKNTDENGIPMHRYNGRDYYHPVVIAQYGVSFLNGYRLTKNPVYLERVALFIGKLMDESVEYNGAIYYPYKYDFPLHNIKDQVMKNPWFSAMAQGQVLSMLVRMYEFTNDPRYLEYAKKTFNSFLNFKKNSKIWVSFIDEDSLLWLEEYPMDEPNYTLNGTIFAVYGVYDFYRIHPENSRVKEILMGSLTTIHRSIDKFRHPGGLSYYCLKHKCQYPAYHQVHIRELKKLTEISGENYFNEIAETFQEDTL